MRAKVAKAQATVLEMIGDLPDADVKPPENVLFVCKLNAVTSDDVRVIWCGVCCCCCFLFVVFIFIYFIFICLSSPARTLYVTKFSLPPLYALLSLQDLRTIFSRFGNVVSCEVIRDYKTGDSLQYAFVEFETEESCIEAYFKMDNVLIDDRRIHVGFSQSVARTSFRVPQRSFFCVCVCCVL